jgi:hypothetical protein
VLRKNQDFIKAFAFLLKEFHKIPTNSTRGSSYFIDNLYENALKLIYLQILNDKIKFNLIKKLCNQKK